MYLKNPSKVIWFSFFTKGKKKETKKLHETEIMFLAIYFSWCYFLILGSEYIKGYMTWFPEMLKSSNIIGRYPSNAYSSAANDILNDKRIILTSPDV